MQETTFHLSTLCFVNTMLCQMLILLPIDFSLYMLYTTPYSISKGVIIFNISLSTHPIDFNAVLIIFFTVKGFSPPDYLHFMTEKAWVLAVVARHLTGGPDKCASGLLFGMGAVIRGLLHVLSLIPELGHQKTSIFETMISSKVGFYLLLPAFSIF